MSFLNLKKFFAALLGLMLFLPAAAMCAGPGIGIADADRVSADIISKYVAATENQENTIDNESVEMDIDASLPKLQKSGHLRALKKISRLRRSSYRVLSFQGDNTVKQQVIARYLQAEQQGHGDKELAVTPANYKFKLKGEQDENAGNPVYVFHVSPRKKRVGLFRGEVWIDARTYLPVYEKGRFVKNPSIFFKRVDFERAYTIQNGRSLPEHMTSTINARLVGRVELNVTYSNFAPDSSTENEGNLQPAMAVAASN